MIPVFRTLRFRNFRLFFCGQLLSTLGAAMQHVAHAWLVYRLTGSAFMLALVSAATLLPSFFLSLAGGVLADLYEKRRILIIVQSMAMLQALALGILMYTGMINLAWIFTMALVLGFAIGVEIPTRQSFVVEVIDDRNDLGNAIALNSMTFNLSRLAGPAVAGLLIARYGEAVCFFLNAVTFVFVIFFLAIMRLRPRIPMEGRASVLKRLTEGFVYVHRSRPLRGIILMVAVMSFLGMSYQVLLPIFARDLLGGGAITFGILSAAPAVGAIAGGLFLASRTGIDGLMPWIPRNVCLFALTIMAFAFSRSLGLSVILLVGAGFGLISVFAASNTLLQSIVDEDKRGRVMSYFSMAFLGTVPVGNLLVGFLSDRIGAPLTVFMTGALCLLAAAVFVRVAPGWDVRNRLLTPEVGPALETEGGTQRPDSTSSMTRGNCGCS